MGGKKRKDEGKSKAEPSPPVGTPHPLTPRVSTEFKRGYKLQLKRGKDMAKLDAIMDALAERRP